MTSPDALLASRLRLPVIGAPMYIASGPELVVAQCIAGIVGAFPALNARPKEALRPWIDGIRTRLDTYRRDNPGKPVAPFAVNQICHRTNDRLRHDLDVCVDCRVPVIITSLRPPSDVIDTVHRYGGFVMHDVINVRHAEKALEQGVDGLIAVTAGAGGHAGTINPLALVSEIRRFFDGPLALSGAISTGAGILAARAMGADFAYMGTRFLGAAEANTAHEYKRMICASSAGDIVYTPAFSGVHGNYMAASIEAAGFDPDTLDTLGKPDMSFDVNDAAPDRPQAWRDIWSAGHGVGTIDRVQPVSHIVDQLEQEYRTAHEHLSALRTPPPRHRA